uniref:Uncharacterized protein n=1 Tax=Plectus sambesii TaxID=2011161 RepID=A0A914VXL2_9BILA
MNGLVWVYPTGYFLKSTLISAITFPSSNALHDSNGLPVKVPEDLQAVVEEEFSRGSPQESFLRQFPAYENAPPFKLFLTPRFEPVSCGLTIGSFGACLALPLFVTFTSPDDVRQHLEHLNVRLEGDASISVDPESKACDQLIGTMILSERAKRFLVRRELNRRSSGTMFLMPALEWVGCFAAAWGATIVLTPPMGFVGAALASSLTALVGFVELKRRTGLVLEVMVDEQTAAVSEDYRLGALEYFEKAVRRNRIVRKLLGTEGFKYYNDRGDFINSSSGPLNNRLNAVRQVQVQQSPVSVTPQML